MIIKLRYVRNRNNCSSLLTLTYCPGDEDDVVFARWHMEGRCGRRPTRRRLQRVVILLQRVVDITTTRSNYKPFIGRSGNA